MARQHPGTLLLEQYLRPRSLSQNSLARAIGVPPRRINEIILGKRAVSADTAVRLGMYFGNSAGYWMHLQSEYDIERARQKIGARLNVITTAPADTGNDPASGNAAGHQHKPTIRKRILR